jgi:hypothetical protein
MHSMQDDRDHVGEESREAISRVVMDAHGNEWVIHEVDTPQAWAHGQRCLIFSCPAIVRRVWSYPEGWVKLPSRELLALLGDTSPVPPN